MKFILLIVCASLTGVTAQDVGRGSGTMAVSDPVPSQLRKELETLMQFHFDLSLTYLYTSIGYGSQRVQRPGMAKHLLALSNSHWEEGINMLQKFFKRGGRADSIYNSDFFNFDGKNMNFPIDMRAQYLETLKKLPVDSITCTSHLNTLHSLSTGDVYHDADWGHYFEEKLEKEEERKRELIGHVTTLKQMSSSSLALHMFDSNL